MNYKPSEQEWMAYLYGELEGQQKENIDQYLLANAAARAELEKFQTLRSMMSSVEDKEVIAPPIFIDSNKQRFLWNAPYLKMIVSIAASLLLIIMVGKLTNTRISVSNNEFRISFGEVISGTSVPKLVTSESQLTAEAVQKMIDAKMNANNIAMQENWKESQQKIDASIKKNLTSNSEQISQLVREAATASQEQIRQYVAGIQSENMQVVKDYFQLTSGEQKKYMEDLLVDFTQYLQQQRANDIQLVQTQLNSLQQNTDIFKQETEQILTSIITTVGAPTSTENKN